MSWRNRIRCRAQSAQRYRRELRAYLTMYTPVEVIPLVPIPPMPPERRVFFGFDLASPDPE